MRKTVQKKNTRPMANAIRVWMRRVLNEKDWSAERWAREAGTSATNITRFLTDGKFLPSTTTIAKLAKAAGYGPDYITIKTLPAVPIGGIALIERGALLAMKSVTEQALAAARGMSNVSVASNFQHEEAFAFRIESDSMNAGGILPRDVVIVLPQWARPPANGNLVLIRRDHEIEVRRYQPPYLLPQSTDANLVPIGIGDAVIVGVVVQAIRDLV